MEALPSGSSISGGGSRESHTSPSGRCFKKKKTLKSNFIYAFIFGCTGSSLLHGLFYTCSEQGLLSSCGFGLLNAVASLVADHNL